MLYVRANDLILKHQSSLQIFFKSRVLDEQGYILFVRKNAIQVLIPKYGLEGTVYLSEDNKPGLFSFNEQVGTQLFIEHF